MDFVPGTGGQIWSLREYDDKMFCCSDNGIFIADDKRIEHLDGLKGVWDIVKLAGHEEKRYTLEGRMQDSRISPFMQRYVAGKVNGEYFVDSQ